MAYTVSRKQPFQEITGADAEKILGIGSRVLFFSSTAATAATTIISGVAVPAGQIQVITNIFARNANHASTDIIIEVNNGALVGYIDLITAPAAGIAYSKNVFVPLVAGEFILYEFDGVTINDLLQVTYIGYQMTAP